MRRQWRSRAPNAGALDYKWHSLSVPNTGNLDYKWYSLSGAPNMGNLDYKQHSLGLVQSPRHLNTASVYGASRLGRLRLHN